MPQTFEVWNDAMNDKLEIPMATWAYGSKGAGKKCEPKAFNGEFPKVEYGYDVLDGSYLQAPQPTPS